MKPKKNRHSLGDRTAEDRANDTLDQLAEFEDFQNTIIPAIRADLKNGLTAPEILKKYAAVAAARTVSIVALEVDSGKALAAAKDIIDRAEGKPKERHEHTHKYDELTDDELDAQVLARAGEMVDRQSEKIESEAKNLLANSKKH
jgi:hypothetical protein